MLPCHKTKKKTKKMKMTYIAYSTLLITNQVANHTIKKRIVPTKTQ